MNKSNWLVVLLIGITMLASMAFAGVPQLISYQGRLTDNTGTAVPDAAYLVKFIIYNDPVNTGGGAEYWNSGFQTINTVDGLFSYELGSNVALPDYLFNDTSRWLGVTVGTDPELAPRTRLTSKGYAYQALRADSASTSATLNGLAPSYYLAWSNMTGIPSGFADGVDDTTNSLAWSALTSVPAGFADGTDNDAGGDITGVTAGSGLTGGGASGDISLSVGTGAITSSHIATNTITAVDIANDAVGAAEISANAVGSSEIATNAVGASEIVNGSIVDAEISGSANIAITKISGTAVNLTSNQTITGSKTFLSGNTIFGDSTAKINSDGIRIGDTYYPSSSYLVYARRNYNTTYSRYGYYAFLNNQSTGILYGMRISLGNTADAGGYRYGLYSNVDNSNTSTNQQYAVYAVAGSSSKLQEAHTVSMQ